jgi:DNA-binding transcriptional ArsR family regulator
MLINQMAKYNNIGDDPLSAIFAALADPTRRSILDMLSSGEATVNELAAPFNMSLPAISKHLKVLAQAGLISRGRRAQWRPCRLEAQTLKQVSDWTNHYSQLWGGGLDGLDSYLKEIQENESDGKSNARYK